MNQFERAAAGHYLRNIANGPYFHALKPMIAEYATQFIEGDDGDCDLQPPRRRFLRSIRQAKLEGVGDESEDAPLTRKALRSSLRQFAKAPQLQENFERNLVFLGDQFALDKADREILRLIFAAGYSPIIDDMADQAAKSLRGLSAVVSAFLEMKTDEVERRMAPGAALNESGLVSFPEHASPVFLGNNGLITIPQTLHRVMQMTCRSPEELTRAILGQPCFSRLDRDDFSHVGKPLDLARAILDGARSAPAGAINLLLYGEPGTGKTELAKVLARETGHEIWSIAETDSEGFEPSRHERLGVIRMARRLLGGRSGVMFLIDEADDVLGRSGSFGMRRSEGSKVYINRLLETAAPPTIWVCNSVEEFDPAYLRRMSLAIRVQSPPRRIRERMWLAAAAESLVDLGEGAAARLARTWAASPALITTATRAAALSGGGAEACHLAMEGLVRAMGGSAETTTCGDERFDPRFINSRTDVAALTDRLAQPGAGRNWSALLSGPPGTGKSQYARYLADHLDMPVLQKRASDLISKWLGESEKQIAQAFEEAVAESALLIFDEADSLLAARNSEHPPWQISQVNEMLTWMESHPLPFVCTTNFLSSLDPASLRRFTFKLDFGFLDQTQAEALFLYRFGAKAPTPLPDRLTPGDFAVVEKRRRFEPGATCLDLVTWLDEEVAVRSPAKAIGFAVPRTLTAKAA